jgi:D-alanyl-D-alanine carboxypeptidase/D-alanyl-D-alanine-endopeptidase (penicillin-binding protein 4)
MFNFQRHTSYIVLLTSYFFLASCSIQKQISRSAKEDVLSNKALTTAHVGISIFDPAANQYLYNYQGDKYFVPASNTKLPTCYAAMKYLGDSLVGFRYGIEKDSIIIIRPSADPTFLHPDYKNQPAFSFLKKYSKIEVLPKPEGAFPSYGNGWSWNDYQETYMAYPSIFPIYGNIAKFKLISDSVFVIPSTLNSNYTRNQLPGHSFEVRRRFSSNEFWSFEGKNKEQQVPFYPDLLEVIKMLSDTISRNAKLQFLDFGFPYKNKKFYSQPTDSLLKPMMHRSDNFFAEQSLLMVSNEMLGVMSDEKIIDTLLKTDFKNLPQKPR